MILKRLLKSVVGIDKWNELTLLKSKVLSVIAPEYNSKRLYKLSFNKYLDLTNPKSINEKLQFLKLNDYYNNDLVTSCCDKYLVRKYIHDIGLDRILPELYQACDKPIEINWNTLPNKFVVKSNHGSGYIYICNDKKKLNKDTLMRIINNWLKEDYWKKYCELQYKFIKKKIIIEENLGENIETYKFYCSYGKVFIFHILNNGTGNGEELIDFYDINFNKLNYTLNGRKHCTTENKKPENFNDLIEIAKKLSEPFPFVRVDLYSINGKSYFSELTFIPFAGFMQLEPKGTDLLFGSWINLNRENG